MRRRAEKWKIIIGCENYLISSHGRIKSIERTVNCKWGPSKRIVRERIITPSSDKFGYQQVNIGKNFRVHRLVAIHFVKNKNNKPQAQHLDNNPSNNYYKNIKWGNQTDNMQHRSKCGRNNNTLRKLTDSQAKKAKSRYAQGDITITALALKYGVTRSTMARILKNKVYKHLLYGKK